MTDTEDTENLNISRLEELATWLENGALHKSVTFNLNTGIAIEVDEAYDSSKPAACNTICCIAGAAVQFFTPKQEHIDFLQAYVPIELDDDDNLGYRSLPWLVVAARAEDLLGLNRTQARDLFTPGHNGIDMSSDHLDVYNDPKWAARTIRHLIETGDANWKEAAE